MRIDWGSSPRGIPNPMFRVFGKPVPVNYGAIRESELRAQLRNTSLTRGAKRQIARQLGLAYVS